MHGYALINYYVCLHHICVLGHLVCIQCSEQSVHNNPRSTDFPPNIVSYNLIQRSVQQWMSARCTAI